MTGQGLLVRAGEGVVLVSDLDVEGARTGGVAGALELLAAGLPVSLS